MIDPQAINPLALPSVQLSQRSQLPVTPCIYFAIDGKGVIQYIGRSTNPRQRWRCHHKQRVLSRLAGIRIAYLKTDPDLLYGIELALIEYFQPPLNETIEVDGVSVSNDYVSRVAKLRRQKNLTQYQLAKLLRVDVSTVRNWEKSRDGVKMFVRVAKLCNLFDCQPTDLYEEEVLGEDDIEGVQA